MHSRRSAWAGASAAILLCQFIGTALGQDAAAPAPIKAVLDTNSRSIRFDPLGISVRIPDDIAVQSFSSQDDSFSLNGDFGGPYTWINIDARFINDAAMPNCEASFANSASKLKTPKKGAEFYDPRWYPKYYESKDKSVTLCLDRPGGYIRLETSVIKDGAFGAMKRLTANMADAFQPESVQAAAAEPPASAPAPALVPIDNLYPDNVLAAADYCSMGYQMQCEFVASFEPIYNGCQGGNVNFCKQIAKWAADSKKKEDYFVAATYYRRSCQLGDTASCKLADKFQKLDRESIR